MEKPGKIEFAFNLDHVSRVENNGTSVRIVSPLGINDIIFDLPEAQCTQLFATINAQALGGSKWITFSCEVPVSHKASDVKIH